MFDTIANVQARDRVAKALRVYFRHSIRTSPDGCVWIETGKQSVHLAELALRLVDAADSSPKAHAFVEQLQEVGNVR